ncbi:hypothetical protein H5410_024083 [Solanum commersonii]|uniref:Uncharacterized protein n=1 Tax=Solanum commersonii TaxID=4109 RepID=A0A9J5ZKZ2_SOLCO|nr:hypothetical protein H5410_024083 [Solanum commersonii]
MSEATTDGFWNSHSWNLSFRRLLNDWEVDRVAEMLKIFEVFQGTRVDLISWNWKGEEIKIFTLRSAFSKLTGPYQVMEWSWKMRARVGTGPEWDHRTGMNRYRTGTGWFDRVVDRYRDEPDRNNRDGGSVPSRPTIYRDRTGTDRNGPERNGMG